MNYLIGFTDWIDTRKKCDTSEYVKEWYKGSVSLQYSKNQI